MAVDRKKFRREYTSHFFLLLIIVTLLCLIGLMMVLSSSQVNAFTNYHDSWYFFKRQALWVGLGTVAAIVCSLIPYQTWRSLSIPLLIVAVASLFAVLVPGVGVKIAGAQRWIGVGQFAFQPSELAKFAIIVVFADLFSRREHLIDDWHQTLRPAVAILGGIAFLVILQPDMGTMMMICGICFTMFYVSGIQMRVMFALLAGGAFGALVLGMVESYRRARFIAFLNPWKDPGHVGYQNVQSLVGLGSGRLLGLGLGESRAKWGFLPNSFTDFIYAIIGEEFGYIGATLVLGLFIAFGFAGARIARRAPDRFGMLLATGITAWIVGQSLLNIGAVVGLLPITGVPLPFVSFGGSSVVILLISVGVLCNVAMQGSAKSGLVSSYS
jgi:cell division protein FtsW